MLDADGEVAVAVVAPDGVRGLVELGECQHCGKSAERAVDVVDGEVVPAGEWTHAMTMLERCGPVMVGDVGGGA